MLFAIMPIYSVGFRASLIMLIALVALMALAAETFRIWTPALNVKYRDIGYVLPFAIQIMMFSDDGNLSSKPDSAAMAIGAQAQSSKWDYRRVSRRHLRPSPYLDLLGSGPR